MYARAMPPHGAGHMQDRPLASACEWYAASQPLSLHCLALHGPGWLWLARPGRLGGPGWCGPPRGPRVPRGRVRAALEKQIYNRRHHRHAMSFNPTAVSVHALKKSYPLNGYGGYGGPFGAAGAFGNTLIGSGNPGPDVMLRVFMLLKLGLDLEVKWALTTVCLLLLSLPHLVNFDKEPFLGHELLAHFARPYGALDGGGELCGDALTLSLDALLLLRNALQDLANQQWLLQIKGIKKTLLAVLRVLSALVFGPPRDSLVALEEANRYHEAFGYLLDLVETLSCYFIDNPKGDGLFAEMARILALLRDKLVVVAAVRTLAHLLIRRLHTVPEPEADAAAVGAAAADAAGADLGAAPAPAVRLNCIDLLQAATLHQITTYLLLNDAELNLAALEFLWAYLTSEAVLPQCTVEQSQRARLERLCRASDGLRILVKQLPQLVLKQLALNDPAVAAQVLNLPLQIAQQQHLSKRGLHTLVPTVVPELSEQLYDIIVKFPEPLRASTWLRCCYEPVYAAAAATATGAKSPVVPGEVTQILLWKAYEKQFERVWQPQGDDLGLPKLLPAVDFIKNVSAAFPHSQAMVVNTDAAGAPKRKFIIKGIQPRQFVVNIDVGNYDALKQKPTRQALELEQSATNASLPIGHVDLERFHQSIDTFNLLVLGSGSIERAALPTVNALSAAVLEVLVEEIAEEARGGDPTKADVFRHENSWMRDVIYVNPGLVDCGVVGDKLLALVV